jgi:superfamily II DNA or RNA helicase
MNKTKTRSNSRLSTSGTNPTWSTIVLEPKAVSGVRELRDWQPDAFLKLHLAEHSFLVAPCGAGKSTLQCALAAYEAEHTRFRQRQLIVVPQSHISGGFSKWDDGAEVQIRTTWETLTWAIRHDFCNTSSPTIMADLKRWLLRQSDGSGLVSAVTSHAALARLWSELDATERAQAVRNLTIRIDEAHHVNGVTEKEGTEESVKLGKICNFVLSRPAADSARLQLTTATPFRGDQTAILDDSIKGRFTTYWRDWIDHWKTLKIADFRVQFLEYEHEQGPLVDVVQAIASEQDQKHLVIVPSIGQKWRTEDKAGKGQDETGQIRALMDDIRAAWPGVRILDLVTRATQDAHKALLLQEPKKPEDGDSKFDVVVTCMLGREGTDWCPCSRIHHTSPEGSSSLAVQTIGRAFRKFVTADNISLKNSVKVDYYVPMLPDPVEGQELDKREFLTDRTNCLLILMQINDMADPILVTAFPKATGKSSRKGKQPEAEGKAVPLDQVLGPAVHQAIHASLVEALAVPLDPASGQTRLEQLQAIVSSVLEEQGVDQELLGEEYKLEDIRDGYAVRAARMISPRLREMGIDVSFIRGDFDKLRILDEELASGSILYGTDEIAQAQWEELRRLMSSQSDLKAELFTWIAENCVGVWAPQSTR